METTSDTDVTEPGEPLRLPIHVDFWIRGFDISYEEVCALDVGQLLDCSRPAAPVAVEICLNGVPVANGELVSADGTLAVRITDIADHA